MIDGQRSPHYMVHVVAIFALVAACVAGRLHAERRTPAVILAATVAVFLLLQVGGHIVKIRKNTYANEYLPTIGFLHRNASARTLIMGPAELCFGMGDQYRLIDDARLGGLTGLSPDIIVLDAFHPVPKLFAGREPDMFQHVSMLLRERFRLAARYGGYRIFLPLGTQPR